MGVGSARVRRPGIVLGSPQIVQVYHAAQTVLAFNDYQRDDFLFFHQGEGSGSEFVRADPALGMLLRGQNVTSKADQYGNQGQS